MQDFSLAKPFPLLRLLFLPSLLFPLLHKASPFWATFLLAAWSAVMSWAKCVRVCVCVCPYTLMHKDIFCMGASNTFTHNLSFFFLFNTCIFPVNLQLLSWLRKEEESVRWAGNDEKTMTQEPGADDKSLMVFHFVIISMKLLTQSLTRAGQIYWLHLLFNKTVINPAAIIQPWIVWAFKFFFSLLVTLKAI